MKRNLTFAGSILGVVGSSIAALVCLIGFFVMIAGSASYDYLQSQMPEGYEMTMGIMVALGILFFLFLIVSIFGIVFNAKAIGMASLSTEEFRAKKGTIVSAITFNFIICFCFYTLVLTLIAAILLLVDLSREKDRSSVASSNNDAAVNAGNVVNVVPAQQEPTHQEPMQENAAEAKSGDLSLLEKDLNALKDLFDKSLLTSEEYEKLRAERINRHLNSLK